MRKVYVIVTTRLIVEMDEGIDINEVLADMDYDFTSRTEGADIIDTEIYEQEIVDSK